jgi:predicted kinase
VTTLIITRGLPGSGKSTKARRWVYEDRANRARINRDDFRTMLYEGRFVKGVTEPRIVAARDGAIRELLKQGVNVINDDTNLPNRTVRDLEKLAWKEGADFEIWDLTDVPLETCVERDSLRVRALGDDKNPVGEDVIVDMYQKFIHGKPYPLPVTRPVEHAAGKRQLYVPDKTLPEAIMVDIDGTVALHGNRDPFDESRVHEDRPNAPVWDVVWSQYREGVKIIFCSGRTDGCREATEKWICEHLYGLVTPALLRNVNLFMRKHGDTRKDSIVKYELFDEHIRKHYNVKWVLDDRNQVVAMWREIGLTCFQVAPGDF